MVQTWTDQYIRLAPVGELTRRYVSLKRRGEVSEAQRLRAEIERRIKNHAAKRENNLREGK